MNNNANSTFFYRIIQILKRPSEIFVKSLGIMEYWNDGRLEDWNDGTMNLDIGNLPASWLVRN